MADGSNTQWFQRQPEEPAPASWNRFFVVLAGKTNGAHESVVKRFKASNQTELKSPEDAQYLLVFCPVVSLVGVDVRDALDRLLPGQEAVLVVMHHTFNPELVVPPSSSLVDDQRVRLTLDCLFHRDKLLKSRFNDHMKTNIKEFFKASRTKTQRRIWPPWKTLTREVPGPAVTEGGSGATQFRRTTSHRIIKKERPMEADGSDQVLKAVRDLEEEVRTMKQQQTFLVQEIKTLKDQNDGEKKKQEFQNELKQKVTPRVKSWSNGGSGPSVGEKKTGTTKHQGASPPQSEDGTKTSRSKKNQQADSSQDLETTLIALKEEVRTMKQQQTVLVQEMETLQVENDEKEKKIHELQNEMEQKVVPPVEPWSSGGSGPAVGEGEPGSMEDQGGPPQWEDGTRSSWFME